jgi:hypothetical protein
MKLNIIVSIAFCTSLVTADRMIRFIFNNGTSPSTSQVCSTADIDKIDAIFNPVERRHLRTPINATRALASLTAKCKDNCRGFATGTCRATGCRVKRRVLNDNTNDRDRQVTCVDQIKAINDELNNLISINAVSENCKSFIDPILRFASCYDDVVYGEIESLALWKITSASTTHQTLISSNVSLTGLTVCNNMYFNIEAKVNDCVDFVRFSIVGPGTYRYDQSENVVPYTVFGDDSDENKIYGRRLSNIGSYTLTITPDGLVTKRKILTFKVKAC